MYTKLKTNKYKEAPQVILERGYVNPSNGEDTFVQSTRKHIKPVMLVFIG